MKGVSGFRACLSAYVDPRSLASMSLCILTTYGCFQCHCRSFTINYEQTVWLLQAMSTSLCYLLSSLGIYTRHSIFYCGLGTRFYLGSAARDILLKRKEPGDVSIHIRLKNGRPRNRGAILDFFPSSCCSIPFPPSPLPPPSRNPRLYPGKQRG